MSSNKDNLPLSTRVKLNKIQYNHPDSEYKIIMTDFFSNLLIEEEEEINDILNDLYIDTIHHISSSKVLPQTYSVDYNRYDCDNKKKEIINKEKKLNYVSSGQAEEDIDYAKIVLDHFELICKNSDSKDIKNELKDINKLIKTKNDKALYPTLRGLIQDYTYYQQYNMDDAYHEQNVIQQKTINCDITHYLTGDTKQPDINRAILECIFDDVIDYKELDSDDGGDDPFSNREYMKELVLRDNRRGVDSQLIKWLDDHFSTWIVKGKTFKGRVYDGDVFEAKDGDIVILTAIKRLDEIGYTVNRGPMLKLKGNKDIVKLIQNHFNNI